MVGDAGEISAPGAPAVAADLAGLPSLAGIARAAAVDVRLRSVAFAVAAGVDRCRTTGSRHDTARGRDRGFARFAAEPCTAAEHARSTLTGLAAGCGGHAAGAARSTAAATESTRAAGGSGSACHAGGAASHGAGNPAAAGRRAARCFGAARRAAGARARL